MARVSVSRSSRERNGQECAPRAPAEPGEEEDDLEGSQTAEELLLPVLGGAQDDRPVPAAPPAPELPLAEEDPFLDPGGHEVLRVGVDGEGMNAGDSEAEQVLDRLAAGPSEADDRDGRRGGERRPRLDRRIVRHRLPVPSRAEGSPPRRAPLPRDGAAGVAPNCSSRPRMYLPDRRADGVVDAHRVALAHERFETAVVLARELHHHFADILRRKVELDVLFESFADRVGDRGRALDLLDLLELLDELLRNPHGHSLGSVDHARQTRPPSLSDD